MKSQQWRLSTLHQLKHSYIAAVYKSFTMYSPEFCGKSRLLTVALSCLHCIEWAPLILGNNWRSCTDSQITRFTIFIWTGRSVWMYLASDRCTLLKNPNQMGSAGKGRSPFFCLLQPDIQLYKDSSNLTVMNLHCGMSCFFWECRQHQTDENCLMELVVYMIYYWECKFCKLQSSNLLLLQKTEESRERYMLDCYILNWLTNFW